MIFKLTIGDYYGDGHCERETIFLESNKTIKEVVQLYYKSVELTGFNLGERLCNKYADIYLTEETFILLESFGMDLSDIKEDCLYCTNRGWELDLDAFVEIFIRFIHLSDPDLELVESIDNIPNFLNYVKNQETFGYGLF